MKWQNLWTIIGIACVLYGCLILSILSGTSFFAVWFVLGGVCFLFAAAARFHVWQNLPMGGKAAFLILVFACLAFFVFVEAKILTCFGEEGEKDLDYIIVLGAQVRDDGPSVVLQYRLDTAFDYLEENPDTLCIVSGGQGANEPCTEAEAMRDYLVAKGIAEERILTEAESASTLENIQNSMKLLDPETDSVGIVTNDFHLYRGTGIARKAGIRHVSGIAAPSLPLYFPNNMLREFFGVVKDTLKGNM